MKTYAKVMAIIFGLIASVALLGFFGNLLGLFSFAFFNPKIEAVRYRTYQESQTYNEGMVRDLENLKMEYIQASPEQRGMLRSTIIHRFSVYPTDRLPMDLQAFYATLTGVTQQ